MEERLVPWPDLSLVALFSKGRKDNGDRQVKRHSKSAF
jgi:hypothetical protein